ncbi:MAG: T9SS type A sorting domain-containing protein [Sphingobacteriales bacterium]|nr:MAG: T9SS type A sorting domain-containing protein [Sphingobacteriales bacterium]
MKKRVHFPSNTLLLFSLACVLTASAVQAQPLPVPAPNGYQPMISPASPFKTAASVRLAAWANRLYNPNDTSYNTDSVRYVFGLGKGGAEPETVAFDTATKYRINSRQPATIRRYDDVIRAYTGYDSIARQLRDQYYNVARPNPNGPTQVEEMRRTFNAARQCDTVIFQIRNVSIQALVPSTMQVYSYTSGRMTERRYFNYDATNSAWFPAWQTERWQYTANGLLTDSVKGNLNAQGALTSGNRVHIYYTPFDSAQAYCTYSYNSTIQNWLRRDSNAHSYDAQLRRDTSRNYTSTSGIVYLNYEIDFAYPQPNVMRLYQYARASISAQLLPVQKDFYQYDAQRSVVQDSFWVYQNSSWVPASATKTIFNAQHEVESYHQLTYNPSSIRFDTLTRALYTYNTAGLLTGAEFHNLYVGDPGPRPTWRYTITYANGTPYPDLYQREVWNPYYRQWSFQETDAFLNRYYYENFLSVPDVSEHTVKTSLYPVPATTAFRVAGGSGTMLVEVFGLDGRLLQTTFLTTPDEEIPVRSLANGVYLVRINKTDVHRLLIQP